MIIYKVCEIDSDGEYDIAFYSNRENALKRLKEEVIINTGNFNENDFEELGEECNYFFPPFVSITIREVRIEDV